MQSGTTNSLQKSIESTLDKMFLEYQLEVSELKEYVTLFLSKGVTKEEIKSTLLDMAGYRHLRNEIVKILEEEK